MIERTHLKFSSLTTVGSPCVTHQYRLFSEGKQRKDSAPIADAGDALADAAADDRGGFAKSWISQKDKLIAKKVGKLKDKDWMAAEEMMNAFRTNQNLNLPDQERAEYLFDILDRLSNELKHRKGKKKSSSKERGGKGRGKLTKEVLMRALKFWRDSNVEKLSGGRDTRGLRISERRRSATCLTNFGRLPPAVIAKKLPQYDESGLVQTNVAMYTIVLHVNRSDKPEFSTQLAEKIFKNLLELSSFDPSHRRFHPTKITVTEMIATWGESGLPDATQKAEYYFGLLKGWHEETGLNSLKIDDYVYCSMMETHAHNSHPDVAFERIKDLYNEMEMEYGSVKLSDIRSLNRVCNALADSNNEKSLDMIRAIFDDLNMNTRKGLPETDGIMYSTLMKAYSKAGRASEAVEVFELMKTSTSIKPKPLHFSILLWAHTRAGDMTGVESTFAEIMGLTSKGEIKESEMSESDWGAVLAAWAEMADENSMKNIIQAIGRLQKLEVEQGRKIVTKRTLNILMSSFAGQNNNQTTKSAEALFNWMTRQKDKALQPDGDTFHEMMHSWSNAGNPARCDQIFQEFMLLHRKRRIDLGKHGLDRLCNTAIDAWAKSDHTNAPMKALAILEQMKTFGLSGDVVTYTSLMWAWARSGKPDSAIQTKKLFRSLQSQWQEGDEFSKPDQHVYNALMYALAHSGDLTDLENAEKILQEMKDQNFRLNAYSYNTIMSGWSKKGQPTKVEALFQDMKMGFEDGYMEQRPHSKHYSTRLVSWARVGDPEATTNVLNEWIAGVRAGDIIEKPGDREFNAVLQALQKSGLPDRAQKAHDGLVHMSKFAERGEFDCSPNSWSVTTVISTYLSSARYSRETAGRVKKLLATLEQQADENPDDPNMKPNIVTYTEVIRVVAQTGNSGNDSKYIAGLIRRIASLDCEGDNIGTFWTDAPEKYIAKARAALRRSSIPRKESMLKELDIVERISREAMKNLDGDDKRGLSYEDDEWW